MWAEIPDWYQNDFGTTFWADSQESTYDFRGETYKNIGSSLSIWDNNLGGYLNYYQNIFLGMSRSYLTVNNYILDKRDIFSGLLNRKSPLDNKFKADLIAMKMQATRLKFMENSLRVVAGGEYAGPIVTGVGIGLAFTPLAPISPLVVSVGQGMGYANSAVTAMDYARAGNDAAAIYTVGSAVVFYGSGEFFKYATKTGNISK